MSFWRNLMSFFNIQVFLMKNVFQNKKQQVFLNQLEVFQNEKKWKKPKKNQVFLTMKSCLLIKIKTQKNRKSLSRNNVFQKNLKSFWVYKLPTTLVYISPTKCWMRTTSPTFVFPFLSSVKSRLSWASLRPKESFI